MARLAVVGGHSITDSQPLVAGARVDVKNEAGVVAVVDAGDHVALHRHGLDAYRAPHAIDHLANMRALAALDCDRILAICSVGGLRPELGVGTFLVPDDFIALHLGISRFDDERGHRAPGFDVGWRERVLEAWAATDVELRDGGIYWQAVGPRLETPAEIRLIAAHADVVGMTLASECVIAGELGISYAAVCIVDNLANGVAATPLTAADIERGAAANRARLDTALDAVLPALAGAPG